MNYNNYYDPYQPTGVLPAAVPMTHRGPNPPIHRPVTPPINQPLPINSIYVYPENLPHAITVIVEAMRGESEDREFYTFLMNEAPNEDKKIITSIINNEIEHNQLFRQLYTELTGNKVPQLVGTPFIKPASYCKGLKEAIQGEEEAVQKYRDILFAMQSRVHINIMTKIITDELRHGSLYNYLYSKNNCHI